MRLTRYINEQYDSGFPLDVQEAAIEDIKKDCKPVLKEIIKAGRLIYRGAGRQSSLLTRKRTRKNRKPLDTHIRVHKLLDAFFKDNYGWRARSQSVMATNEENSAYIFGEEPFLFFPIGKYKVLWKKGVGDFMNELSPWIEDFFIWFERWYDWIDSDDLKQHRNAVNRMDGLKRGYEMTYGRHVGVVGALKIADFLYDEAKREVEKATRGFTTGNLSKALASVHSHELMFNCKEYYLLKISMKDAIIEEFNLYK